GNQNLAVLWGGDNESNFSPENGLPTVVTAGLGAGISGMALWTADRGVYLPDGQWIDYWSGKHLSGGNEVIADAPPDVLPLYARAGAILPKIPEDVMTLVPPAESGNTALKTLDNRRVYELLPNATGSQSATVTDFEGRTLSRTGNSLEIDGKAARVILRWRFDPVNSVTLGGAPLELHNDASGRYVEFDHTGRSTVNWKYR